MLTTLLSEKQIVVWILYHSFLCAVDVNFCKVKTSLKYGVIIKNADHGISYIILLALNMALAVEMAFTKAPSGNIPYIIMTNLWSLKYITHSYIGLQQNSEKINISRLQCLVYYLGIYEQFISIFYSLNSWIFSSVGSFPSGQGRPHLQQAKPSLPVKADWHGRWEASTVREGGWVLMVVGGAGVAGLVYRLGVRRYLRCVHDYLGYSERQR